MLINSVEDGISLGMGSETCLVDRFIRGGERSGDNSDDLPCHNMKRFMVLRLLANLRLYYGYLPAWLQL